MDGLDRKSLPSCSGKEILNTVAVMKHIVGERALPESNLQQCSADGLVPARSTTRPRRTRQSPTRHVDIVERLLTRGVVVMGHRFQV